jgi:hypothetical protein
MKKLMSLVLKSGDRKGGVVFRRGWGVRGICQVKITV